MTRGELAAELAGVLRLLREHAFLRYTPSGAREYEEKQRNSSGYFATLIAQATGVSLGNPFPYGGLEGLSTIGPDTVSRVVKRTGVRLAQAASRADGMAARELAAQAEAWYRAAEYVSRLPRF